MNDEKRIEESAARLAAHGIKTGEDFARYCRAPGWFCWLAVAFGCALVVAFSLPLISAGLIPARWLALALVIGAPVGAAGVFGLRALLD